MRTSSRSNAATPPSERKQRMTTIKSILVPVDFSGASANALEMAIDMAQAFDAELTLLHAWELPVYPYMEFMLSSSELSSAIERGATQRLESTLQAVRARVPRSKSKLMMGVVWQKIIEAIDELKPELVIMGTHGRHGLSHALLGSVAEKIVRLSPVPVLTTRAP